MTPAPPPYDHLRRLVEARIREAMWLGAVLGFVVGLILGVLL